MPCFAMSSVTYFGLRSGEPDRQSTRRLPTLALAFIPTVIHSGGVHVTFVEVLSIMLLLTSLLLIVGHHLKIRRERLRPTLRHRLVVSYLTSGLHRAKG